MLYSGAEPLEGSRFPAKSQILVNNILQLWLLPDRRSWLTPSTQMGSSEPKAVAKGQGMGRHSQSGAGNPPQAPGGGT